MTYKVITILFFFVHTMDSQVNDTLNKFSSRGRKQNFWKVYFDKNYKPCDSANASFYGFDFYDNGKNLTKTMQTAKKANCVEHKDTLLDDSSAPKAISGQFIFYYKKRATKYVEIYLQGRPLSYSAYNLNHANRANDCLTEYLDFTKLHDKQIGSFYVEYRSCNFDRGEAYWFRKEKGRWKLHKIGVFKPSERAELN
jgi:hypothetical protein